MICIFGWLVSLYGLIKGFLWYVMGHFLVCRKVHLMEFRRIDGVIAIILSSGRQFAAMYGADQGVLWIANGFCRLSQWVCRSVPHRSKNGKRHCPMCRWLFLPNPPVMLCSA